jgi:periplasmic divalent cation tolerance protein
VQSLVEAPLAACVNLLPRAISIYRWQGAVKSAEDTLLLIKTTHPRWEALKAAVVAQHPIDTLALNSSPWRLSEGCPPI